ncbi:Helix-turn-helix [Butyrivibrio hungatei DSM 14810]|uniref:Helix-turn-helix n=1 Tax=Butyrivibrio hungatei DSM 14810 TaxID=1121132 RepID=A0A1M7SUD3_9FIRM|nr:ImmA/IrrE family metallo-endopeptidase [Butyrivibrio hungatei]SHN62004.1 Helix-turn-helix [Butyrivibrio hungatei DSM 14810]
MRSFREFLKNKHYELICESITEYIYENKRDLNLSLRYLSNVDKVLADYFNIKFVLSTNNQGLKIDFDVIVEVELEIYDYSKKHERIENTTQWFTCHCEGSLEDKLEKIKILYVEEYCGVRHGADSLSDDFIPCIKQKDLDSIAACFLKKYYPKALLEPLKIDTFELARSMGLTVVTKNITNDGSIFGQLYFEDCNAFFYDDDGALIQDKIAKNTIVLDPSIFYLRDVGSVNHTIVHECVHKEYHYKKYLFESIYNENYSNIDCSIDGNTKRTTKESYMEWQANALAAHILMPENMFKMQASKFLREVRGASGFFDLIDVLPMVIDKLADYFGVSRMSAKIRLVEVGYEEAIGIYDYMDGKYLRPYSFSKGALKQKQTFSINLADAALLVFTDSNIRNMVEQGFYIYAESHFVINSSKYIIHGNEGPMLTEYALSHMDECCLIFNLVIDGADDKWHASFYLNRSDQSPIRFRVEYNNGLQNSYDTAKKNEVLAQDISDQSEILRKLPEDFSDSLKILMKWRNLSQKEIADKARINEKTISRALHGENISLENVILICLALQTFYSISEKLIRLSGNALRMGNHDHQFYNFVLLHYYADSLDYINDFLISNNVKPL